MIRLLFVLLLLSGCKNHSTVKQSSEKKEGRAKEYPHIIDSLKLNDFYDSAKFCLYIYHCDIKYEPKLNTQKEEIFLSYLNLVFDTLNIKNDTLELYFNFMVDKHIVDPNQLKKFIYLKNGVGYRISDKKKLYLTTDRNVILTEVGSSSRFVNALQPDVLKFLKMNKDKLDSWLKKEVERRGIAL